MPHKSVFIAKIAAELAEIRRELHRLAAETSPSKDGAKSLYEAYKKEHPGTEKTVIDIIVRFYSRGAGGIDNHSISSPYVNTFFAP